MYRESISWRRSRLDEGQERVERDGVLGLDGTEDAADVGVAQRRRSDLEDPAHGGPELVRVQGYAAREEPREVDARSGVARALEDRPRAVERRGRRALGVLAAPAARFWSIFRRRRRRVGEPRPI